MLLNEVLAFNDLEEAEPAQLQQASISLRQGAPGICHGKATLFVEHGPRSPQITTNKFWQDP